MSRRKVPTGTPLPKALACGMLKDDGRMLFLVRKDQNGTERIELPCILVYSGRSPFAEISSSFREQTGIDGECHEIIFESIWNSGSRKRKAKVPVLVFKITAKNRRAKLAGEFSGFRWLNEKDALKERKTRKLEWFTGQAGT